MHIGHEYITLGGIAVLLTQGPVTFFLMRFAEKVCNDPEYENKVFNRRNKNKKHGNSKKG